MQKERLENLRKLRNEVGSLAGGVIDYMPKIIADTVTGSTAEDPRKQLLHIEGIDKKYDELEKHLKKKALTLINEITTLENWLDDIKNPALRTAFRMRYGQGQTWEDIGWVVECDRTTIRDKCERYLAEIERENE